MEFLVYFLLKFSINMISTYFCSDFHSRIVVRILCSIKNIRNWIVNPLMNFLHCILKYKFWLYEITMNMTF